jgi:hypothetical protein
MALVICDFSHNIFLQFWPLFGKIWQSFKNLGLFVFRASGEPAVVLVRRRRANPAGKVNVQVSVLFPGYCE